MAKMNRVANEFTKLFIGQQDKYYALNKIVYELNYLVYAKTREPLSYKDKSAVIAYMFDTIAGRRMLTLDPGETIIPRFGNIVHFFERTNFFLKHLKAGSKQQAAMN